MKNSQPERCELSLAFRHSLATCLEALMRSVLRAVLYVRTYILQVGLGSRGRERFTVVRKNKRRSELLQLIVSFIEIDRPLAKTGSGQQVCERFNRVNRYALSAG